MRAKPVGMLVIRTWTEEGSPTPLRAQVTSSVDVATGIRSTSVLTRPRDVLKAVRAFLDSISLPED
jgi:hypothetical protein